MLRKLTDTFVGSLKPGPAIIRVWDVEVKGFGLRVTPAGHKSYIFQFTRELRKIQATIGNARCWSCKDARERARELRKLHEDGKDARGTLMEERGIKDLEDLVESWREDYKPRLRPHSKASFESLLKRILPVLGRRLVKDLALSDVEALHRKIAKEGHEVTANRAVTFLRRLLSIAEKKGWRPLGSNPASHFERPSEESRELGYPPQVFDTLLGHKVAGVAGVYTRLSPAGGILAEASQATADWIMAAMEGRNPTLGQKVKPTGQDVTKEDKEASA